MAAQNVESSEKKEAERTLLNLSNDKVQYSLVVDSGRIVSEQLLGRPEWVGGGGHVSVASDCNFRFDLMWTDWQAPKMVNNAENPVMLDKNDFLVDRSEFLKIEGGKEQLVVHLKGNDIPLLANLVVQLDPGAFYVRKKLVVIDTSDAGHFLQKIFPLHAVVGANPTFLKDGGFGQPVACRIEKGGAFFGLEYPAADNIVRKNPAGSVVECGQEIGSKIGRGGVASDWLVEGVTPDSSVKWWFMKYVDDIRVAPLRPYTLYNSWYDLRSSEYPRVPEENRMNEKNISRIIGLIRKNMIDKHNIKLDAFVLDDGWDVYASDWVLRDKEFPRGLKPIADELKKTNTSLGMWFGPTGGYSFRMKRIDWMKSHGYEVVGNTDNTAMMCLAGRHYSDLFRKRVTDFVADQGVGYFKWDGLQFSCSESDHGHPVGIYSRRAVMESLIDKVHAVRDKNPNIFLNITSGTWLSPWWVKYANTIWMQGADYGYADVPSISPRDAATTYRDFVLYDDFRNQNMWFPIANLMTHGIIKGNLEWLGGREEPLDKFTNEVMLYLARGVSMWELYVSPDILTDGEWDALAHAMMWAKERFPVLSTTEMVGGDPTKRETYGYVHFSHKRGIIAARNPWVEASSLTVKLDPSNGLDADASSLVVEKVYPTRWIDPKLYAAGSTVALPLDGYETAIYEVYAVTPLTEPLIAGATFESQWNLEGSYSISIQDAKDATILNPESVNGIVADGQSTSLSNILSRVKPQSDVVLAPPGTFKDNNPGIESSFTVDSSVVRASLSILLTPAKDLAAKRAPRVLLTVDGKLDTIKATSSESQSQWYSAPLASGKHDVRIEALSGESGKQWKGRASIWIIAQQKRRGVDFTIVPKTSHVGRLLPPRPLPPGVVVKNVKLGEASLESRSTN